MNSYDVLSEALNIQVRYVMRRPPVTVLPSESIANLMYRMIRDNIGAVIVKEKESVMGIITEKDVLDRAVSKEKNLYSTQAKEIMSKPIISVEAKSTLREALDMMRKHNIRRLAVTENEVLIGIVSERRLLRNILNWHV